jgi:hypothetical protein
MLKQGILKRYGDKLFCDAQVTRAVLPLLTKETGSSVVFFSTVAVGKGMPFIQVS